MTQVREIKATANNKARTFTIRCIYKSDNSVLKYRTLQMDKDEFKSADHWTQNDWENFLRYSQDYFRVK